MSRKKDVIKEIKKHDDLEGTLDLFEKNNISEDVIKSDVVENKTPDNKDIDMTDKKNVEPETSLNYIGRGFKTLQEAEDFVNTVVFAKLGEADKNEYINWLKNK